MTQLFKLWCHIEGDEGYLLISISPTQTVSHLRDQIYDERHVFFTRVGCRAVDLTLTKIKENLRDPEIKGNIRAGRYRPTSDDKLLEPFEQIDAVWPEGPLCGYFHVLVGIKKKRAGYLGLADTGDQRPSKKQRLEDPFALMEKEFTSFWDTLWNENVDLIHRVPVIRDSDLVEDLSIPPTIRVLQGLPKILSSGSVFIRNQYDDACQVLESLCADIDAVVITGHPGIGKTMFLYYLLALRLRNKQPTFFQFIEDVVILFDSHGVTLLPPDLADTSAPNGSWALIDSNAKVKSVPAIFTGALCPYFVVVAASPCEDRWQSIRHYRPRVRVWFMEPFTLEELIQARELDKAKPSERNIQAFFEMYGPSARDCFAWCSNIDCYDTEVRRSIKQTSWDTLAKALISAVPALGSNEGPHRIILVAPEPEDHFSARTTVVTMYISRLLWDADAAAHRQNHCQLFKTLILAPAFIGQLIEPAFHRMCVRGYGRFTLHPMSRASVGPVNYVFKTSESEQETLSEVLRFGQRELFALNTSDQIPVLDVKQYYQPTIPNQCSYDSFIYDLDGFVYERGPSIDRDQNLGRVIAFQIAASMNHNVKLKGLHALRARAQELGINDIRLVIVTSQGSVYDRGYNRNCQTVACSVEKTAFDELKPKIYMLKVDEHKLYAGD